MNLLNLISKEEPIGGLEIVEDTIRFARLKRVKSGLKIELLIEEKISSPGVAKGDDVLTANLLKFAKKNHIEYVIVSIPADNVFVKTYNFPSTMPDEKIDESMQLTVDLQLPKKRSEIFCDFMKITEGEEKKILLSCAGQDYIGGLISKIKKAGLKIVAIESHPLSLARAIKQNKDEAVLVAEKGPKITSLAVIRNNQLIFSWSIPNDKIASGLSKEITRIANYHDWFNIPIKNLILLGNFTATETKKLPLKITDIELPDELKQAPKDSKWLISLGAALRGLIPRKDDRQISLMAIGTETAYRQEKALATVNFFVGISTALSIFFVVIFIATWSLLTAMQNNYSQQISSFNLSPSSENSSALKEKANAFNDLIGQIGSLVKKEPHWSKIVNEIKNKTTAGIIVNNLSLPSAEGQFSVTGSAADREAINTLKKSFESSELFTEVSIPLTNLGKKADIPFSMTFKIKDSQLIYSQ